jgi:hypothetical protein
VSGHSVRYRLAGLAALAVIAGAQTTPHVRNINFYGLRKVSSERALREARLRAGDLLPGSRGDLEDRLSKVPGVSAARVEAVCCEGPDADLFIGIEERGVPHVAFRSDPTGDAALPAELAGLYHDFLSAVTRAGSIRSSEETRPAELQFTAFAETHADDLRQVSRTAADPEQRAIAATVLGFGPWKQSVVDDLQYLLQDPDDSVRGNALGSLRAFAALSQRQGAPGLRVSPTWLIALLNSIVLSDRMQSADLLITLTDRGDRAVLDEIRTGALPALVEMARWENLRYALPPFLLIGRLAGLTDQETQRRWSAGEREPVIRKALSRGQRKR